MANVQSQAFFGNSKVRQAAFRLVAATPSQMALKRQDEASGRRPDPKVEVLAYTINRARRDRRFGRIEARVTVCLRYHPLMPSVTQTVLTSVPVRSDRGQSLRVRLVDDAVRLAVLLHRSNRDEDLKFVA